MNKLKGEIDKLKFENNKLKQRSVVTSHINTINTRRKKKYH